MKDAYSFHANQESLDQMYDKFVQAYTNIFNRCGLKFRMVEADSGQIGGSQSAEFMALAEVGGDNCLFDNRIICGEYRSSGLTSGCPFTRWNWCG